MAWTNMKKNPFSSAVLEPEPFLPWITRENSFYYIALANKDINSTPMTRICRPKLRLCSHFSQQLSLEQAGVLAGLYVVFPSIGFQIQLPSVNKFLF